MGKPKSGRMDAPRLREVRDSLRAVIRGKSAHLTLGHARWRAPAFDDGEDGRRRNGFGMARAPGGRGGE